MFDPELAREPKFTPGPWFDQSNDVRGVRPLGDTGYRYTDIVPQMSDTGTYRGSVAQVSDAVCIKGITIEERDANARLIAAAPDLYKAALKAYSWILFGTPPNAPDVRADLEAAITIALEGRPS